MSPLFDAVVVGAGPAGSAAATILARRRRKVLLLEKDRFPRHKVCGEFLSSSAWAALDRLGVREAIAACRPESIGRGLLHLPGGARIPFALSSPAIGISRFALDDLLARHARDAGAETRFETRVLSVERREREFAVRLANSPHEEIRTGFVVGAWGRWDAMDRALARGFLSSRQRFVGWSRDYCGDTSRLERLVQLFVFPGGYCGLSRVEEETANLAGVVSEEVRLRVGGGWEAVVAHATRFSPALDGELARLSPGPVGFRGTGPVFFTSKPPAEDGILMAGDAAGVIDPFSGEGQATALASGILAADTIERSLAGELAASEVASAYANAWKNRFASRFAWSRLFRHLMLTPSVGAIAARLAGERLVSLALKNLSAGRA
ncbi:MAG TPA: NAD(P)/FAD-dependent oxidoreductase [Thermoanaerobaculia bacterium]